MPSKKWLVIGISGATSSGKTSIAKRLHKELKNSTILHQDDYFLPMDDPRHIKIEELNHFNWEVITSMDMDRMRSDIFKIMKTSTDERNDLSAKSDRNILILEGFILFKDKIISNLCDVKYCITLTKEDCWQRRKKRVYDPPDVPGYFEKVVWPEYSMYMEELTKDRDLCESIMFIDGLKTMDEIFETIFTNVKKKLA
ncbi:nicotinamide riboside kinase 1 [Ceratina calcarata]|uniref:Nicotinamide riboside kinase 1 n=1 Tax=Ceratina calcarata TaxID=156304 RepID=A0AAJ7N3G4_9HYME|nr:nicotinamide riboside kinase 1 [Ceratina calcarata]